MKKTEVKYAKYHWYFETSKFQIKIIIKVLQNQKAYF